MVVRCVSCTAKTPGAKVASSADFPARPVGFMLPRTGPGTCASPKRIEQAKKTKIIAKDLNLELISVVTGFRKRADD